MSRIGFDGKRAVRNLTGIGNYSRLVIEHLGRLNPADEFMVYTPKLKENPRLDAISQLPNVEFRLPPPQGFKGNMWRTFGVTNNLIADKVDLYHGLSNELPLNIRDRGIKSVVTIHDLIFLIMPQAYGIFDRLIYNYKFKSACRNADHIIAISECTKRDIMRFYGTDESKISVVYQGCDDIFRKEISSDDIERVREKYALEGKYIIQVGTVELRKNLELTVRALAALEDTSVKLVVVGRDHLGYKKRVMQIAGEEGVSDRIVWLEGVPFADLPALYKGALVSAYPSRYEGFGIPVLESLEVMTPVVAAKGSCLEEAGGKSSLYVSPDDPREMVRALDAILQHKVNVDEIRQEGKKHAARFSTENMVAGIREVYDSLLSEG